MSPDAATLEAMREALEDEYCARATYRKIIDTFGPVQPFVNIVEAEDRHAKALLSLFARFGVEAPVDTWPGRVTAPSSLVDACRAGVEAEIENAAMYERLLARVTDTSVADVLRRLRDASQERHLPAFQRCLERETMGRRGTGARGAGGCGTDGSPRRGRGRGRPAADRESTKPGRR